MGRIIYIRHGQASVFSDNYDQLSELGMNQAVQVGKFLKSEGVQIDRLFTGPLHRHHQTLNGMLEGLGSDIQPTELEGLREHQGYSILKQHMAELIEEDQQMLDLVNRPWTDFKDQIKHHIRVFEHFSLNWIEGRYDHLINDAYQSWHEFSKSAASAFQNITDLTNSGETSVVITSGGPKAIACGDALDLSSEKVMRTSWVIYNCSITEFLVSDTRTSLSSFNHISYLTDQSHRTLV